MPCDWEHEEKLQPILCIGGPEHGKIVDVRIGDHGRFLIAVNPPETRPMRYVEYQVWELNNGSEIKTLLAVPKKRPLCRQAMESLAIALEKDHETFFKRPSTPH